MARTLEGVRVAALVSDGFEQVELDHPAEALRERGATVEVLVEDEEHLEHVVGMDHLKQAEGTDGDRLLEEADPEDYHALLIPGGAVSPDAMRRSGRHLDFVRRFVESGKPTFVICHGAWLLADAGVAAGRVLTSWEAIRLDLERAGAEWVNEPVVIDRNLVTARKPADLPAFVGAMVRILQEGRPAAESQVA